MNALIVGLLGANVMLVVLSALEARPVGTAASLVAIAAALWFLKRARSRVGDPSPRGRRRPVIGVCRILGHRYGPWRRDLGDRDEWRTCRRCPKSQGRRAILEDDDGLGIATGPPPVPISEERRRP